MGTLMYRCGCSVTVATHGEHDVLFLSHCGAHRHLHSEAKTLYQMAVEIGALSAVSVLVEA